MIVLKEKTETIYSWKNIHLNRSRVSLFAILLVLAFMLFVMNIFPTASVGVIMIPISYGLGALSYKKLLLWKSGNEGQIEVTKGLMGLGDEYSLINSIVVPPNRGDTDHIVIGPNGIFVIETKTLTGTVVCDGDDWERYKIGRGGGKYEIKIGSPSRQVKRNSQVIKDFILRHGKDIFSRKTPHIWVEAIVVFTGDTTLEITKPTVSVIRPNELTEFIKNKDSIRLATAEIEKLGKLLLAHC